MPEFKEKEDDKVIKTGKITRSHDFKEVDQAKVISTHDHKPNQLKQPVLCISTRNVIPKREQISKKHRDNFLEKYKKIMKK